MPVFDSFTALLESEEPLIHKVRECIMKLVKELFGRFVNMQCMHEARDSLLDIDFGDPTQGQSAENWVCNQAVYSEGGA